MKTESIETKYYLCLAYDYDSYRKGKVYPEFLVSGIVDRFPKDWKEVSPYPNTLELIDCIENGKNKTKVLEVLKQWKSNNQ